MSDIEIIDLDAPTNEPEVIDLSSDSEPDDLNLQQIFNTGKIDSFEPITTTTPIPSSPSKQNVDDDDDDLIMMGDSRPSQELKHGSDLSESSITTSQKRQYEDMDKQTFLSLNQSVKHTKSDNFYSDITSTSEVVIEEISSREVRPIRSSQGKTPQKLPRVNPARYHDYLPSTPSNLRHSSPESIRIEEVSPETLETMRPLKPLRSSSPLRRQNLPKSTPSKGSLNSSEIVIEEMTPTALRNVKPLNYHAPKAQDLHMSTPSRDLDSTQDDIFIQEMAPATLKTVEPLRPIKSSSPYKSSPSRSSPPKSHKGSPLRPVNSLASTPSKTRVKPTALSPVKVYTKQQLDKMLEEVKAKDPKLLKKVNIVTKTKEEVLSEMVVSFDSQVMDKVMAMNANYEEFLAPLSSSSHSDPRKYPTIRFQRNANSVYYKEKGTFVPVEPHLETENMVGLFVESKELPVGFEDHSFGHMLREIKRENHSVKLVIFLNNFESFLQSLKTKTNRAYVNQIRKEFDNEEEEEEESDSQPKKKRKTRKKKAAQPDSDLTSDIVEAKLMLYEIEYGVHFFPIKGLKDLFSWLKCLCFTLATKETDNRQRNMDFSNVGVVKSGKDSKSTFVELLKQVKGMTPGGAKGIVDKVGVQSVSQLKRLFDNNDQLVCEGRAVVRSNVSGALKKILMAKNETDIV